jgi:ABC-2 type transport system permease protein
MDKIWRITRTEYLNSVRSRAFLIGLIMLPVFMFGGVLVQRLARNKIDISPRRFAVVDRSGKFFRVIAARAAERNDRDIFDWSNGKKGRQIQPTFVPQEFHPARDEEKAPDLVLSRKVRAKELFAFVIIGADVGETSSGKDAEVAYHTETPAYQDLPGWLERTLSQECLRLRIAAAQLDEKMIHRLTEPVRIRNLGLTEVKASGQVVKARETNPVATFALPMGSMFLLFMLVMTSAPNLLNTVLEEKMNKIAEVLVASVSPFQLMLGKLFGAVLVSMTLSFLYLSAVAVLSWKFKFAQFIPVSIYFWFILFQFLAFFIYGSVFLAIGSTCNEIRDAQSMMAPAMLIVMLPVFVWVPVMQSPTSAFSRTMSFIPTATPMLMLLRIAAKPGPPWWEILVSVCITTVFMLACVWIGAKIFRVGILSQGQPPTFRKLISWAISK